jgi:hypothetical protein
MPQPPKASPVHSVRVPLSEPLMHYLSMQATLNGTSVGAEVVLLVRHGILSGQVKPTKKVRRQRAYPTRRVRVPLDRMTWTSLHMLALENDAPFPAAVKAAIARGIRARGVDLTPFINQESP